MEDDNEFKGMIDEFYTSLRTARVRKRWKHRPKPLYAVWCGMKQRCSNPNSPAFKDYGGRGIYVCSRWMTFENFEFDMGTSYKPGLSLDRINNDGNYEPWNCRWATRVEQRANQRHRKTSPYYVNGPNYTPLFFSA